ncbi:MAG TPA: SHOCT domain-containing protein [Thermoanaerobaculia bacterium]
MSRFLAAALAFTFAFTVSARDTRKELNVTLKFAPQEGVQSNSPDLAAGVTEKPIALLVEDARGGDAAVIGQGTNDDDATFPIRATSDVVPFIHETLKDVATNWGVKIDDGADRVLTIRLARFTVDESNKALGSVYEAEARLAFVLSDKSGKKLAEGSGSGSATRYGRARSADNCNEVLSDSLKEAFATVLSDSRLQDAWTTGRASSASSSSTSAPAESVEERLRKLDELLKKGLITKEEYDKKRAEILKDI